MGINEWDRCWRPKRCPQRYATTYEFNIEEEPEEEPPEGVPEEPVEEVKIPGRWCPCCMRIACEPVVLECGHSFCRRCLANMRPLLLEYYPEEMKDRRSVMRCPVPGCKNVLQCLPFINGDFRFWEIRPTDKIQLYPETMKPCEVAALTTYHIEIDVDMTVRKSDDLFVGFDDVEVIP